MTVPNSGTSIQVPQCLLKVQERFDQDDWVLVVVGGYVRDAIRGVYGQDIDCEVYGDVDFSRLKRCLAEFGVPRLLGKAFGVIKLQLDGYELDFSLPRLDSKVGIGHTGFEVKLDGGLDFETAAKRRDFSMNSMGYRVKDAQILDPYGGRKAIQNRLIQATGPAFVEDPLRVFRAMQFAARLGFQIDEKTLILARSMDMSELSKERIYAEMKKCILTQQPSQGLKYLFKLGIQSFLIELQGLENRWSLLMDRVDQVAQLNLSQENLSEDHRWVISLAALLSEFGDSEKSHSFLERFIDEKGLIKQIITLLEYQQYPAQLYESKNHIQTDIALRVLSTKISLKPLHALCLAIERAVHAEAPISTWFATRATQMGVFEKAPDPIITGDYLLSCGVLPGPQMGQIIDQAYQAQLEQQFNSIQGAKDWLYRLFSVP